MRYDKIDRKWRVLVTRAGGGGGPHCCRVLGVDTARENRKERGAKEQCLIRESKGGGDLDFDGWILLVCDKMSINV